MDATYNIPGGADRVQRLAVIAGVVALAVVALAAVLSHDGLLLFFRAYLVGFVFWTGIAIGSLAILMLQHLSGGAWGMVIRRPLEAATRTLPLAGGDVSAARRRAVRPSRRARAVGVVASRSGRAG